MNAKIIRLHAPRRKRESNFTPAAVREILAALAKLERRIERIEKTVPPLAWWEEGDTHE